MLTCRWPSVRRHKHRARAESRSLSAFAQQTLNLQMGRVVEIFERQVTALNGWVMDDQSALWFDVVVRKAEGRLLDWLNSRDLTTGSSKGLATYKLTAGNSKEVAAAWQVRVWQWSELVSLLGGRLKTETEAEAGAVLVADN